MTATAIWQPPSLLASISGGHVLGREWDELKEAGLTANWKELTSELAEGRQMGQADMTEGNDARSGHNLVDGRWMIARFENMKARKHMKAPDNLEVLLQRVESTMSEGWAHSTWRNYGSTWNQCQHFIEQLPDDVPLSIRIMIFLEECQAPSQSNMHIKKIGPQSAYVYAKRLSSIYHLQGIPVPDLRWYRRGLKRKGALHPEHQAVPATASQIRTAMAFMRRSESIGLLIAWTTCSRIDEICLLTRESVKWVRDEADGKIIDITFDSHKGDPFRLGTVQRIFLKVADALLLQQQVETLSLAQPLTTLTWETTTAALKEVDPSLTGHSIKRGALLALLLNGADLETIRIMAKHHSIKQLLTYLPKELVSERMGTIAMSRILC